MLNAVEGTLKSLKVVSTDAERVLCSEYASLGLSPDHSPM